MSSTVIYVWIGLSVFASVLVLAAVIRSGQVEQMARNGLHEGELFPPKSPSVTHASESCPPTPYAPGCFPTPERE